MWQFVDCYGSKAWLSTWEPDAISFPSYPCPDHPTPHCNTIRCHYVRVTYQSDAFGFEVFHKDEVCRNTNALWPIYLPRVQTLYPTDMCRINLEWRIMTEM